MKNVLIIVANPKLASLSFGIAKKYQSLCQDKGYKVELIDLYREEHQQPFFTFEKYSKVEKTPAMSYFQEKINNADEIVFVFPFWWGSMPAILKNFIDWNFAVNFAFKYTNRAPIGLLKGKDVKVFTTNGGPYFHYWITGGYRRLKRMLLKQVIGFCGMHLKEFNVIASVDSREFNAHKALEKITL
ncbi:hypothetical protein BGP78_09730 [Pseudoalteromonas sp. MSK9-3]|uniref:NAD(P)H-dependent oxidoreductase n=1 Tax=Pseudoalteromonas sp. MSK9-3 TaxID=1897633 RepID=UPI000E6B603D|nr:NAD(P)H-dependent oxidoreductase [Pseudoalteromonas sp. MSK9-3]RJE77171.1 hypothetical protein BGP78_09730 [Pseudoalteromonas sp. MSK9-3]